MNHTLYLADCVKPHREAMRLWQSLEVGDTLTAIAPKGAWQPGEWSADFPRTTLFLTPFLRETSLTDGRPEALEPVIAEDGDTLAGTLTKTAFTPTPLVIP